MGNASATEACSVRAPPREAFEALEVETFLLDFFCPNHVALACAGPVPGEGTTKCN